MVYVGHIVMRRPDPDFPEECWCSICKDVTSTRWQDEGFDDPFGGVTDWAPVCDNCGEYRSADDTDVDSLVIYRKDIDKYYNHDNDSWVAFDDATEYDIQDLLWSRIPKEGTPKPFEEAELCEENRYEQDETE